MAETFRLRMHNKLPRYYTHSHRLIHPGLVTFTHVWLGFCTVSATLVDLFSEVTKLPETRRRPADRTGVACLKSLLIC